MHVPRFEETKLPALVDVAKRDSSKDQGVVGRGVEVFRVDGNSESGFVKHECKMDIARGASCVACRLA